MILDIMLPDGDGFSLFRKMREKAETSILFLSAKDEDNDRLFGLGLGADDYITKAVFIPGADPAGGGRSEADLFYTGKSGADGCGGRAVTSSGRACDLIFQCVGDIRRKNRFSDRKGAADPQN